MSIDPIRRFEYFGLVISLGSLAVLLVMGVADAPRWAIAAFIFVLGFVVGAWGLPSLVTRVCRFGWHTP